LFLVLIGKFDQKSNFQSDWPSALLEPCIAQMGRKRDSQESTVVLDCFYVKLLPIKFFSILNWEV